jgi:RNA polymerase sigma factor (sigma-70 family)
MDRIKQEVDKLYKEYFGKMLAFLLCSFRGMDAGTAEDIVQDSFSSALTDWKLHGIPVNAPGWIYTVCRHKALNRIRRDRRIERFPDEAVTESEEIVFSDSMFDDQQLKLFFACAHPDLSPKIQVVITLKYVMNLKVEAIANVLAMTVDGVDKLLVRARHKIREDKILLEEPHPAALKPRLPIIHKIIYLLFNEGYKSSWGKEILREELCEEALLLNKSLMDIGLANKETEALHALMLFNSARLKARFGTAGELLDLETQDRALWNTELIQLASNFLRRSQGENVSSYHIEASIAYLHCMARDFKTTDWKTIADLYARLLKYNTNPFVELNHSIALYYAGEKKRSFELLYQLLENTFLNQYYLLNATLGKFHHLEGDDKLARQFLLKASQQTKFLKEKNFIHKMIRSLNPDQ